MDPILPRMVIRRSQKAFSRSPRYAELSLFSVSSSSSAVSSSRGSRDGFVLNRSAVRFLQHRGFAASAEKLGRDTQDRSQQPVLVKRLPDDYVQNTLLPHLEHQLLYNIHVYGPGELARIARAYTTIPYKQKSLIRKLSEQIKFRLIAFSGMDLVETVNAMWLLIPEDEELFEMLGERIVDVLDDFNALNLIGIIRVYNKIEHYDILNILVPRLKGLLRDYDIAELAEMLLALAHTGGDAVHDMDALVCLMPEIMRRFDELPLQMKLQNLWCTTKLKIIHEDMLANVCRALNDPEQTRGMPPFMLARVMWIYSRSSALSMVMPSLEPLFRESITKFSAADFARLSSIYVGYDFEELGSRKKSAGMRSMGDMENEVGEKGEKAAAAGREGGEDSSAGAQGAKAAADEALREKASVMEAAENAVEKSEKAKGVKTKNGFLSKFFSSRVPEVPAEERAPSVIESIEIINHSKKSAGDAGEIVQNRNASDQANSGDSTTQSETSTETLPANTTTSQPRELMTREQFHDILRQVGCALHASGVPDMGRKDVILLFFGSVQADLLDPEDVPDLDEEAEKQPGDRRNDLLAEVLMYFREEQDHFQQDELERIVTTLWFAPGDYKNLIEALPKSWTERVDEILLMLEKRELEARAPF